MSKASKLQAGAAAAAAVLSLAACGGAARHTQSSTKTAASSSRTSTSAATGADVSGLTSVCSEWGMPGMCTSCYVPQLAAQVSKGNLSLSDAEDGLNAFLESDVANTPSWMMGIATNCD